ncbi:MAG: hypothetical protein H6573_36045 [Lewinellaceae bacterium]|nr:hypothetical protein [Lewinellaceae bacterium]
MKTDNTSRIVMIALLFIMIFIMSYFINLNLPYWYFRLEHTEVQGKVENVQEVGEGYYKVRYSFLSEGVDRKRERSVKTAFKFKEGDPIMVMYNKHFPNYVEIEGVDSSPNFFRTLLPVILPLACTIFLILGFIGKIDLDKFS